MNATPLVSVLMAVFNGEKYLRSAVESILSQSLADLEFILVDDGSTDSTPAILASYARADQRIHLIHQENCGLAIALNRGLETAQGRFLARLDADDIALTGRLTRQIAAMQEHPEWVVCGSAYELIDANGTLLRYEQQPQEDTLIRWQALFYNPIAHPTAIVRLEALRSNGLRYDPQALHAEDYALWSQLLKVGQAHNLPEALVQRRLHELQVTRQHRSDSLSTTVSISQQNLAGIGVNTSIEQVAQLREWYYHFPRRMSGMDLPLAKIWLQALGAFACQPGLDLRLVRGLRARWALRMAKAAFPQQLGGLARMGWFQIAHPLEMLAYMAQKLGKGSPGYN